jgi:hypothetical protein
MAPDLADHAYGHCLAVLLHPHLAEEAAREALRRGPRTATAVLAQARYLALAGGEGGEGGEVQVGPIDLGSAELTEVARQLTAGRPSVERAIVDLHGRHGLDRLRFARTLGLEPTTAAARAAAVAETWAASLDPALLARLGPGDCEGLAEVLAAGPPITTIESLLAVAPHVAGHVDGCEACRDRLRAMISVADLVSGIPLEAAPPTVRAVLQRSSRRRRRAAALPPPLEPDRGRRARRHLVAAAAVAGVVAAVAIAGTAMADHLSRASSADRVQALTKVPAVDALAVDRATISVPGGTFVLMNLSGRLLHWRADSPVGWLSLDPSSGNLQPRGQARLRARLQGGAPEGQATVVVAITGDDGSVTAVRATTTIGGAGLPDVATSISQCVVTATAEAPQGIAEVVLHWQLLPPLSSGPPGAGPPTSLRLVPRSMDPSAPPPTTAGTGPAPAAARAPAAEHILAMAKGDTGYTAALPAQSTPIQWWVVAAGNGGDQVDTPTQVLAPGSCR